MNIFVARLNYDTTSEDLRQLFEGFGEVSSAKVIYDRETGKSKGFGFVEMDVEEEALAAIEELNESEFHERTIVVKKARPQQPDNRGGGRNNNRGGGGGYGGGGGGGGYGGGGGGGGRNNRNNRGGGGGRW